MTTAEVFLYLVKDVSSGVYSFSQASMEYCAVHLPSFVYLLLWLPGEHWDTIPEHRFQMRTKPKIFYTWEARVGLAHLHAKSSQMKCKVQPKTERIKPKKLGRGDLLWLDNMQGRNQSYQPLKLATIWYMLKVTAMKGAKHLLALKITYSPCGLQGHLQYMLIFLGVIEHI